MVDVDGSGGTNVAANRSRSCASVHELNYCIGMCQHHRQQMGHQDMCDNGIRVGVSLLSRTILQALT